MNGRVADRPDSEVQAEITAALSKIDFPKGTYWDFGRNIKRRGEEFAGLGLAVFLAIALIYVLLASQFESFIYPLVVLTAVPLSVIGVILALFISGRAFGLTAFIGLLMLIGIVVTNAALATVKGRLTRELAEQALAPATKDDARRRNLPGSPP